jgi:SAM-dependent methyltransferase
MDFKYLESVVNKYKPMVLVEDLNVISEIISYVKPNTVLELGVGSGGWILAMNELIKNNLPNINYLGFENFSYDYKFGWPKNEKELEYQLKNFQPDLNVSIINKNVNLLNKTDFENKTFDVVRLDCLDSLNDINNIFYKVLPNTSKNCIFLVDDITPNICPNRFLAFLNKTSEGILKPLYIGRKEAAWCKYDFDCEPLQKKLYDMFKDELNLTNVSLTFSNITYNVISVINRKYKT